MPGDPETLVPTLCVGTVFVPLRGALKLAREVISVPFLSEGMS